MLLRVQMPVHLPARLVNSRSARHPPDSYTPTLSAALHHVFWLGFRSNDDHRTQSPRASIMGASIPKRTALLPLIADAVSVETCTRINGR